MSFSLKFIGEVEKKFFQEKLNIRLIYLFFYFINVHHFSCIVWFIL